MPTKKLKLWKKNSKIKLLHNQTNLSETKLNYTNCDHSQYLQLWQNYKKKGPNHDLVYLCFYLIWSFCMVKSSELVWFFCPKRLHDFFLPWSYMIFLSWQVVWFFCCPKRLRDFFVPRSCVIFLSQVIACFFCYPERFWPERLQDFFLEVACFFCFFFVWRGCVILFFLRSCAIFQIFFWLPTFFSSISYFLGFPTFFNFHTFLDFLLFPISYFIWIPPFFKFPTLSNFLLFFLWFPTFSNFLLFLIPYWSGLIWPGLVRSCQVWSGLVS